MLKSGCRPNFFLPVRVLSRLYRRLFLQSLQAAFDGGKLKFFGVLTGLHESATFRSDGGCRPAHREMSRSLLNIEKRSLPW